MPDAATPCGDLEEARRAIVTPVHGHNRRAFCAAIALEWTNAKHVFEGHSDALLQLLRAHQHVFERAKAFWRTATHVGLQERRRSDHECDLVFGYQGTDRLR